MNDRTKVGLALILLAAALRLAWVLAVPTIPVGDFATYRESAMYLAEHGHLDHGFVYMPGLVVLLAALHSIGGEVLADKLLGAVLGALGAGAIYALAARLCDDRLGGAGGGEASGGEAAGEAGGGGGGGGARRGRIGRALASAPVGLIAGLAYALWPAGIAMSSVVGTDIPAAAAIVLALAVLAALGPARPRAAALAFGAAMGAAAYLRAVALPLTALAAGYWVAARVGARATLARTALGIGATVLVLLPWGIRNWHASGELYLTDSHGGVTALMGNDPNSEGTYSRALGIMFRDLTGRTFLSEPHRETDRAAYALVKRWIAFEPAYAAGMVAMRLERLFAPERGLLYWPVYRPGVLPPPAAAWFGARWHPVTALADMFYLLLVAGAATGAAFAVVERRWGALVPLPFAAALAGIYALFVAEPRYRLTTEVLLFPTMAFGWWRLAGVARAARARLRGVPLPAASRRGLAASAAVLALLAVAGVGVVRGGAALRARHRWATTVARVDGRAVPALWRRADTGGPSPVRGSPAGATLALPASAAAARAQADVLLADEGIARATFHLRAGLVWEGPSAGAKLVLTDEGGATIAVAPAGAPEIAGEMRHAGRALRLRARLEHDPAVAPLAVRISALDLTSTPAP